MTLVSLGKRNVKLYHEVFAIGTGCLLQGKVEHYWHSIQPTEALEEVIASKNESLVVNHIGPPILNCTASASQVFQVFIFCVKVVDTANTVIVTVQ